MREVNFCDLGMYMVSARNYIFAIPNNELNIVMRIKERKVKTESRKILRIFTILKLQQ